jgi:hypothetical protein
MPGPGDHAGWSGDAEVVVPAGALDQIAPAPAADPVGERVADELVIAVAPDHIFDPAQLDARTIGPDRAAASQVDVDALADSGEADRRAAGTAVERVDPGPG